MMQLKEKTVFIGMRRGGSSLTFMLLQKIFFHAGKRSHDLVADCHASGILSEDILIDDLNKSLSENDLVGCFRSIPTEFTGDHFPELKIIFLMRDPRESVISWFYAQYLHDQGVLPAKITPDFAEYLSGGDELENILDRTHSFLEGKNALIVHYKDLVMDPVGFFGKIIDFLDFPVVRSALDEVLTHASLLQVMSDASNHNRSGAPGLDFSQINESQLHLLNDRYGRYLRAYDYPLEPTPVDRPYTVIDRRELDSLKRYVIQLAHQNGLRIEEIRNLHQTIDSLNQSLGKSVQQ